MRVLIRTEVQPLPQVGDQPPRNVAVARVLRSVDGRTARNGDGSQRHWGVHDAHTVARRRYAPKPGDLYDLPGTRTISASSRR
jgi:hypothetical protein